MHSPKMHGIRRIGLQLLAELQDMIVNRARGRIILIAPDFIQQFIARDDTLGILHKELQGLEFLRGERYQSRHPGKLPSF